jgi:hyaluronan synthase
MLVLRPMHLYAMVTCWKVGKWGTREAVEVAAQPKEDTAVLPDEDTVNIPRVPIAKLLDPETETTLTLPIPRQRATAPQSESTPR